MSNLDDLGTEIVAMFSSVSDMFAAQQKLDHAIADEVDKLWQAHADLRDDLYAVANRVESVFRCTPDETAGLRDAD